MKNMEIAITMLKDELEGMKEYKEAMEKTDNQELFNILEKILPAEKQHASMLLNWVTKYSAQALK